MVEGRGASEKDSEQAAFWAKRLVVDSQLGFLVSRSAALGVYLGSGSLECRSQIGARKLLFRQAGSFLRRSPDSTCKAPGRVLRKLRRGRGAGNGHGNDERNDQENNSFHCPTRICNNRIWAPDESLGECEFTRDWFRASSCKPPGLL